MKPHITFEANITLYQWDTHLDINISCIWYFITLYVFVFLFLIITGHWCREIKYCVSICSRSLWPQHQSNDRVGAHLFTKKSWHRDLHITEVKKSPLSAYVQDMTSLFLLFWRNVCLNIPLWVKHSGSNTESCLVLNSWFRVSLVGFVCFSTCWFLSFGLVITFRWEDIFSFSVLHRLHFTQKLLQVFFLHILVMVTVMSFPLWMTSVLHSRSV